MPIFSVGHSTRPISEFLDLLKKYDIAWLADVRTQPYSKFNPQYNRESLHRTLKAANINYIYLGDTLGGRPQDPSCYDTNGKVHYHLVRQKDFFKKGMERLNNAYKKEIRLAIMCSERSPEKCHRSKLIGSTLQQMNIPIQHIDETGELKQQQDLPTPTTQPQLYPPTPSAPA